mmetsp:Transcript_45794/g.121471  ORF Transcript_45794/g.121471 Transcript_45794/m.121471 type:complete len:221 (+) Transcript_45794:403-1065(+)
MLRRSTRRAPHGSHTNGCSRHGCARRQGIARDLAISVLACLTPGAVVRLVIVRLPFRPGVRTLVVPQAHGQRLLLAPLATLPIFWLRVSGFPPIPACAYKESETLAPSKLVPWYPASRRVDGSRDVKPQARGERLLPTRLAALPFVFLHTSSCPRRPTCAYKESDTLAPWKLVPWYPHSRSVDGIAGNSGTRFDHAENTCATLQLDSSKDTSGIEQHWCA